MEGRRRQNGFTKNEAGISRTRVNTKAGGAGGGRFPAGIGFGAVFYAER